MRLIQLMLERRSVYYGQGLEIPLGIDLFSILSAVDRRRVIPRL